MIIQKHSHLSITLMGRITFSAPVIMGLAMQFHWLHAGQKERHSNLALSLTM